MKTNKPEPAPLEGAKIIRIVRLSAHDLRDLGWDDHHGDVAALELADGSLLLPSRDEEGNGPGVFFQLFNKRVWTLLPPPPPPKRQPRPDPGKEPK